MGGGTAGSALATRLSLGLPKAKILLVEAGPSALDELRINVPGLRGSILGSSYDWNFTTVPQGSLGGRSIDVNRGKFLGGSSGMNYLCYDRASAPEYDAWRELGSPGWGWKTMIAAMTKSENFTGPDDGDRHGRRGPIRNYYNRVVYPIIRLWQPTVAALGININDGGSLSGAPVGVMFQPTNINVDKRTRSYAANSYLPLAGSNLEVLTNTQVTKVNLAKRGKKESCATGVTLPDGTVVHASEEVILSAGSIQSPGLLELSGIGQSKVLQAAGITPHIDLPGVGENYQDHIRVSNTYRLKDGFESFDNLIFDSAGANATGEMQKWLTGERSLYEYTSAAYGFMTWNQLGVAGAMKAAATSVVKSTNVIDAKKLQYLGNAQVPNVEILYEANYVGAAGYTGGRFMTLISTVMQPFARGSVHINPANPQGKPVIDPRFASNEYDIKGLVEAAKFSRRIAHKEPMRSAWEAETEPGEAVKTDAQWRAFAASTLGSFYHPVGTCAMLPRKDGGVVDADLKVYGVANLRVVDNSIIPIIPSAHIQTAAYGIAEVAADKIIAAHTGPHECNCK